MRTHEDQGGVQILVMFLQEFFVKLFGYPVVVLVEPGPMVFLSGDCVLFRPRAAQGSQRNFCWA